MPGSGLKVCVVVVGGWVVCKASLVFSFGPKLNNKPGLSCANAQGKLQLAGH